MWESRYVIQWSESYAQVCKCALLYIWIISYVISINLSICMCDTCCLVFEKWHSFGDAWFKFGETQGAFKIHVCIYICILLIVCNKAWGNFILYNCIVMCHVTKLMQKLVKRNNSWWPSPLKGNVESKLLKWRADFESFNLWTLSRLVWSNTIVSCGNGLYQGLFQVVSGVPHCWFTSLECLWLISHKSGTSFFLLGFKKEPKLAHKNVKSRKKLHPLFFKK
jgi:hypothetical protein